MYQTINRTVANGLMVTECGSTHLSQEQSFRPGSAGIPIDLALLDPDPYWVCGSGSGKEAGYSRGNFQKNLCRPHPVRGIKPLSEHFLLFANNNWFPITLLCLAAAPSFLIGQYL
jgi:hypothetical protein